MLQIVYVFHQLVQHSATRTTVMKQSRILAFECKITFTLEAEEFWVILFCSSLRVVRSKANGSESGVTDLKDQIHLFYIPHYTVYIAIPFFNCHNMYFPSLDFQVTCNSNVIGASLSEPHIDE